MRALVQDGNVVHRALPPDLEDDVVPVVQAMPSYLCVHAACDDGKADSRRRIDSYGRRTDSHHTIV